MGTHLARGRASHHSSWREGTGSEPLGLSGSSAVKTLNDGSTHSSLFSKHLPGGLTENWWGGAVQESRGSLFGGTGMGEGVSCHHRKDKKQTPQPQSSTFTATPSRPFSLRKQNLKLRGKSSKGRGHKDVPSHEGRADAAARARSQSRARPLEQCHQQDAFIPNAHQAERLLRGRGGAGAGRP